MPNWVYRISKALPRLGWDVTLCMIVADDTDLAPWRQLYPDISIRPIYGRFDLVSERRVAFSGYLDALRPDVIVPNNDFWLVPAVLERRRLGRSERLVGVCHSDEPCFWIGFQAFRDSFEHVVGVSEFICAELQYSLGFPPERVSCVPCGVPTPEGPPRPHDDGPIRLVYASRLAQYQKRVLDCVELIRILVDRGVDFRFDFFGSGPQEHELKLQIESIPGTAGRVHFHGIVPPYELPTRAWAKSDIFILTSAFEGTPVALMEAMAHGVVPIVSRVRSGVEQLVREGETGFLFEVGDMQSCANHIQWLANHRDALNDMAYNAWKLIRRSYSIEKTAKAFARALEMAMERPVSRPISWPDPYTGKMERLGVPKAIIRVVRRYRAIFHRTASWIHLTTNTGLT